ncbi:tubulin alpha-2 chain-like [Hibiscus syriacus]|uniref:tubulin alpha-2 chain-like n=1 Tax=Hibiscus syriacus TaxID=106335 RepID=UPI0019241FC6|nr:tubulin alpha-2 chain-like [Hibiscus syriacus]
MVGMQVKECKRSKELSLTSITEEYFQVTMMTSYRVQKFIAGMFLVFNDVGRGTGFGLGSLLLELLYSDFDQKFELGFTVYSSPQVSTSSVKSYSSVLSTHSFLEHTNIIVLLDNEATYDICRQFLDIEWVSFTNFNHLVS